MNQRLEQLDSLRGLAAITVLLGHILLLLPFMEPNTLNQPDMGLVNLMKYTPLRILWSGHEAVLLFFVLSGFVLSLPFQNKQTILASDYISYAIKRILRIYVPYACAVGIAILAFLAVSRGGIPELSAFFNRIWTTPLTADSLWAHLFLIGDFDTNTFNPVIWSLVHEMRISLIFPLIMILLQPLQFENEPADCIRHFFFIGRRHLPFSTPVQYWVSLVFILRFHVYRRDLACGK